MQSQQQSQFCTLNITNWNENVYKIRDKRPNGMTNLD